MAHPGGRVLLHWALMLSAGACAGASAWATSHAATPPAVDDVLQNNPVGDATVVEVLLNDGADVDPSTLALLDPTGGGSVDEVAVAGEGTWSLTRTWHNGRWTSTHGVQFLAEPGFVGDPRPIEYTVADTSGTVGQASITLSFQDLVRSDVSLGNVVGEPIVVIDVLANDDASVGDTRFSPSYRELSVDATGRVGNFIDFAVPGEGEWEPRIDDTMEFFPAPGFRGNPSPQEYSVLDAAGNEYFASLVVGYAGLDPADVLLANPVGAPVSIDVLGNDPVGVDAGTLQLVDPVSGDAADEVVVGGEGRWTIGPDLRVVFTPEAGFRGDPGALAYTVDDASGASTGAEITLTFQPLVRNDCSLDNLRGRDVAIDVLDNDDEALRFETLAMSGPLRERRLPGRTREDAYRDGFYIFGEGRWSVDSVNRRIVFEPDFSGATPSPREYSLLDDEGNEHFGTITVTYEGMPVPPETACRQVLPASPTTTTTIATVEPSAPATTAAPPATELPATGDSPLPIALLAACLLAVGTALARRSA